MIDVYGEVMGESRLLGHSILFLYYLVFAVYSYLIITDKFCSYSQ